MTQSTRTIGLPESWLAHLKPQFDLPYMQQLRDFLRAEKHAGKIIYPESQHIFAAFKHADFSAVKVVILGQDPYHGQGQAHGLSFSVPKGTAIPPSLVNIYKELNADVGIKLPSHGCLEAWANQGVLLLNSVLTVEAAKAASHQKQGWEQFTDSVISALNEHRDNVVFMLWGSYAQRKGAMIDRQKHLVLEAPHPSPLSAYRGFLGCQHFSQANEYLQRHHIAPIDWAI